MTFDPMKFYEDGQRKQKRYDSLVPVFLVAVALLVGFYAFFVAYRRSHVKPKPVAPALVLPKPMHDTEITCPGSWDASDEGCNTWRNQTTSDGMLPGKVADPPFMYQCNGGQYVTDLRDCKTPVFSATFMVPLDTCNDGTMVRDGFKDCKPRKHKRKADELFAYTGHGGWHDPRYQVYEEFRFINTIPMALTCTKRTKTSAMQCVSRPLTPAEIEQYKPMAEGMPAFSDKWKANAYDQLSLDHDQIFYDDVFVPGHECTDRERYRQLQCQMGGKCLLRNLDSKNWCKPETTPQDITNLMEQIVPTDKQEPVHYRGDGSKQPCTKENRTHCLVGLLPECKPTDDPSAECWSPAPSKPDCKMPADIDVCPQTVDPRTEKLHCDNCGVDPVPEGAVWFPVQVLDRRKYSGDGDDDPVRKPVTVPRCDEKSNLSSDECWQFLDPKAVSDKVVKP